jgi:hypothetical protein
MGRQKVVLVPSQKNETPKRECEVIGNMVSQGLVKLRRKEERVEGAGIPLVLAEAKEQCKGRFLLLASWQITTLLMATTWI